MPHLSLFGVPCHPVVLNCYVSEWLDEEWYFSIQCLNCCAPECAALSHPRHILP